MAILGWAWLKERLSFIQKIALLLVAYGVAHELWHTQSFSWTACGFVRFIHFII